MKKIIYLLLAGFFLLQACSDDNNPTTDDTTDDIGTADDDPDVTLEEQRTVTLQRLTGGSTLTWRIETAKLTNTNGVFDISENFNVADDEFIFNTEGNLTWNIRNDIPADATDLDDTRTDYYRSPISSELSFTEESATELLAFDGSLTVRSLTLASFEAVFSYEDGSVLELEIVPKTAADYPSPPGAGDVLNFTEVFSFNDLSYIVRNGASGMIGSYAENSFYISFRDINPDGFEPNEERVIKYNATTGLTTQVFNGQADFVTKRLQIIDDNLVVFGGQYVTTYPLDLSAPSSIELHGDLALTRFGYAVSDDLNYIVGGSLDPTVYPTNLIWSWDGTSINEIATLPNDSYNAGSQVLDGKLYIFGGVPEWTRPFENLSSDILVYDLETGALEDTYSMSQAVSRTHVGRYEHLIFVAGQIITDVDSDDIQDDGNNFFGVFNTLDNSFTELSSDLDDSGTFQSIYDMALFNGKMYVIYGTPVPADGSSTQIWQVMSASIE